MTQLYIEHKGRRMLANVVVMRLGLIFLLVFNHAFAPFSGGSWDPISDTAIAGYEYISNAAHYISMPALIFISGYLFGHSWHKTKTQSFKKFALRKFKRLIIPSIIFSLFYYFFFYDLSVTPSQIAYKVINGCGHLWFLPMLFWCFIISYIIETINFNKAIILSAAIVLAILPIPAMPLRLTSALQYFPFYYAGTLISRIGGGKPLISNRIGLLIASIIYLLLQVISYNIPIVIDSLVIKILSLCAVNASKVGLGFSGIGIAFFATGLFLEKGNRISPSLVILSTFCYGVYIFHQFILKALYYHSPLTDIISPVYLPWICFIITVTLSLLLSFLTLKTRLGRFLIG